MKYKKEELKVDDADASVKLHVQLHYAADSATVVPSWRTEADAADVEATSIEAASKVMVIVETLGKHLDDVVDFLAEQEESHHLELAPVHVSATAPIARPPSGGVLGDR